jgi:hypothetical protein
MAAMTEIQLGQQNFLMRGGTYELPLQEMRKKGLIDSDYTFREYPKSIRISQGMQTRDRSTKDCEGRTLSWQETKEAFTDIIVNSESEEERVLSGGRTSTQLEEDRQSLLLRCKASHIVADPTWSAVRLRRTLGDALDAPAPGDNMAKLEAELASLKKMAAMQAEIDALRQQLAKPIEAAIAEAPVVPTLHFPSKSKS